jgi:dienelactone hydrolase
MISKEISLKLGETTMDGTITSPEKSGTYPGVVFVAGSGPTDRNWESPLIPGSHGSARMIAEQLSQHRYVTLRYDKRVSGPRAKQNLPALMGHISMESHFEELRAAVTYLMNSPEVDPKRVFVLTSSEGAAHALQYQTHTGIQPFHGMIFTGAPGRALSEITNYQIATLLKTLPDGADLLSRYQKLIKRFEDNLSFNPDPKLPESVNTLVASLNSPANQPFSREFWSFRAADYIGKITVPVLIIIGKKDLQTDWKLEGDVLEQAVKGKKNVTFYYPENANHVLKFESRPRTELDIGTIFQTYNTPDAKLDPKTIKMILNWLDTYSSSI